MIQPDLFNYNSTKPDGDSLKAKGMKQIEQNDEGWISYMREIVIGYARTHSEFTADDIRRAQDAKGYHFQPHHCNCWGTLFGGLARRKLIEKTGRYVKSTIVTAHARMIPVWRKI